MKHNELERRRAKRKARAARKAPGAEEALMNAVEKGYITIEEAAMALRKKRQEEERIKLAIREQKKPKHSRKARIIYGLNTNSM